MGNVTISNTVISLTGFGISTTIQNFASQHPIKLMVPSHICMAATLVVWMVGN